MTGLSFTCFSSLSSLELEQERDECYRIIWVNSGKCTFFVDCMEVVADDDSFLFIGKSRMLCYDKRASFTGYIIRFTDDFFCRTSSETRFLRDNMVFDLIKPTPINLSHYNYPLTEIFAFIENECRFNKGEVNSEEIIRMQIRSLMLLGERSLKKKNKDLLVHLSEYEDTRNFQKMVNLRYAEITNISAYAEEMLIPVKRLIESIEKTLGCSPKALVNQRRLLEAKRLLAYCTISIKEISARLGFTELTNFTKFFKQQTGVTPSEYRESLAIMIQSMQYAKL